MDSSSSSCSSVLSFQSSFSGGSTPEYDPTTAYEALAPLWWDERDWYSWGSTDESEDESLTDGEDDLQFLVAGELEAESDDARFSGDGDISSDEEEEVEDDPSSEEYPPVKRFRAGTWDDDDDDEEDEEAAPVRFSRDDLSAGSSADDSEYGDDEGSDGGEGANF